MIEHLHIDRMVNLAIFEDGLWQAKAKPSRPTGPRVLLRGEDGVVRAQRAPFRRKGHWCVRYAGTARLTAPQRDEFSGLLTFLPKWN